jgi:X-Pro dipeptidyl-peptidase (S15 family)
MISIVEIGCRNPRASAHTLSMPSRRAPTGDMVDYARSGPSVQVQFVIMRPGPSTGGPWPVLSTRLRVARTLQYGKNTPKFIAMLHLIGAARRGFVVVVQDTRERFTAEGGWDPWTIAKDGYDIARWAAALPHANGSVGKFAPATSPTPNGWVNSLRPLSSRPSHQRRFGPTRVTGSPLGWGVRARIRDLVVTRTGVRPACSPARWRSCCAGASIRAPGGRESRLGFSLGLASSGRRDEPGRGELAAVPPRPSAQASSDNSQIQNTSIQISHTGINFPISSLYL